MALQEVLVLLVPDGDFDDVFRASRLTELRMLLASVAGRIEIVTDSPGLQMSPREALELREHIAAGAGPRRESPPPSPGEDGDGARAKIVTLREKLAEVRGSTER